VSYKSESVHAIRQYEFGPPEPLRYEEVADPVPVRARSGSRWRRRAFTSSTPSRAAIGKTVLVPEAA
jgi:hypothetical protein